MKPWNYDVNDKRRVEVQRGNFIDTYEEMTVEQYNDYVSGDRLWPPVTMIDGTPHWLVSWRLEKPTTSLAVRR